MKKLLLVLGLFAFTFASAQAATTAQALSGAATNSVVGSAVKVNSIVVANGGTNVLYLTVFDAPSTTLTYTNGAFTSYSQSLSNYVTAYTNVLGISESWTNRVVVFATNTTAAATNNFNTMLTLVVPAGTTQTYTPVSTFVATRGVLLTNSAPGVNATFTIDYVKQSP